MARTSARLKNRAQDTALPQSTDTRMRKKTKTKANQAEKPDGAVVLPGSSRPRAKRGSLHKIVGDIPLDVALEIFKHLEPLDLLRLSRTSRALRTILMCRATSRQVWAAARANIVGLPSIPDDMSEPSYASFAFESICYACGRGPCQSIVWDFRMHCHDSCASKVFYTEDELKKLKNWSECVSTMITSLSGTGSRKGPDCIPCLRRGDGYHSARKALGWGRGYLPSVIKTLRLEYMEVKDEKERLIQWKRNKAKEYSERQEWNKKFKEWYGAQSCERWVELALVRSNRRSAIEDKLKNLGWEARDFDTKQFQNHPWVNQPKPLTEQSWANMAPRFVELLEEIQTDRSEWYCGSRLQSLKFVYDSRRNDLIRERDQMVVPFLDFILLPHAEGLLDATVFGIPDPLKPPLDKELASLVAQLDHENISKDWLARKEVELQAMLNKKTRLPLSTVIFQCKGCHCVLWAPQVYAHFCHARAGRYSPESVSDWKRTHPFDPKFNYGYPGIVWEAESFACDSARTTLVKQILDLCGAGDLTELEEIDPLLECLDCPRGPTLGQRAFFRWQTAVTYHHRYKNAKTHTFSIAFDVETRTKAEERENKLLSETIFLPRVICKLCPSDSSLAPKMPRYWTVLAHMKACHKLAESEVKRGVHWSWRTFDETQYPSYSPLMWIPRNEQP